MKKRNGLMISKDSPEGIRPLCVRGQSPDEAMQAAYRDFGNVTLVKRSNPADVVNAFNKSGHIGRDSGRFLVGVPDPYRTALVPVPGQFRFSRRSPTSGNMKSRLSWHQPFSTIRVCLLLPAWNTVKRRSAGSPLVAPAMGWY
jgi:hypothetical protein